MKDENDQMYRITHTTMKWKIVKMSMYCTIVAFTLRKCKV